MRPPPFTPSSANPSNNSRLSPHPLLTFTSTLLTILLVVVLLTPSPTSAHGYLLHPPSRAAGPATLSACGKPITDAILRDNTSHIEGLPELSLQSNSGFDPALCNLWLCRGLQFGDNRAAGQVQAWRPGQVVGVKVKITIPHDGSANVSVVDARENRVVGEMLRYWGQGYANEREFFEGSAARNQTEFNVTVPEDLGGRCARAGDCVSIHSAPDGSGVEG